MDISKTTEPRSDQLNFDDVAVSPLTITVTEVKAGPPDQPVHLHNAEFPGRPYKPGLSMRRVLIAAWGKEASEYVGRRITIYGDPTIRFGKEEVGGIRISHLSHIDGEVKVNLTVTRGRRAPFVVQPLETRDTSGRDWLKELTETNSDRDLIGALGRAAEAANASPAVIAVIRQAFNEAKGE